MTTVVNELLLFRHRLDVPGKGTFLNVLSRYNQVPDLQVALKSLGVAGKTLIAQKSGWQEISIRQFPGEQPEFYGILLQDQRSELEMLHALKNERQLELTIHRAS